MTPMSSSSTLPTMSMLLFSFCYFCDILEERMSRPVTLLLLLSLSLFFSLFLSALFLIFRIQVTTCRPFCWCRYASLSFWWNWAQTGTPWSLRHPLFLELMFQYFSETFFFYHSVRMVLNKCHNWCNNGRTAYSSCRQGMHEVLGLGQFVHDAHWNGIWRPCSTISINVPLTIFSILFLIPSFCSS